MSIFITYPHGKEIEVDLEKFNPDDYSEWEFDTPDLYDGEKLILRFSTSHMMKVYREKLKSVGIYTDTKLYEFRSEDSDLQYAKDFIWENIKELDLSDHDSLTSLEHCPQGLTELNLEGCRSLTSLKHCPQGLTELDLDCCESLTSLKYCPSRFL